MKLQKCDREMGAAVRKRRVDSRHELRGSIYDVGRGRPGVVRGVGLVFLAEMAGEGRIVPELNPQPGVTHLYRGAVPKLQMDATYSGEAWARAGTTAARHSRGRP
jgi:hypothetical protein